MECNLGDFAIYYETHGTGRPIVMLPGIPSDHGVMERFMEPLFTQREGWLRLYPDLPGTGRTPGVDRLPAPFGGPTLILTARQDNICGYRDAWDLLDDYPRATFACGGIGESIAETKHSS